MDRDKANNNNANNASKHFDVKITTTSTVWRDILCNKTSAITANLKGNFTCDPGIRKFGNFMRYFDLPDN